MAKETEDHRHCIACGKVTPPDTFICSEECEEKLKSHQDQMKRKRNLQIVFLVALVAAVIILSFVVGGG
ncbi:hypothetical protein AKJ48_03870 [candidate division MSBL1 archaeon SCGC-AAA261O19]|uniref:DUF2116 family Zn-ribbon domain-containing protein n=1 Tax=candidate division MSBL1 archaeon SCGC-AAA261O19 TaxID=1698277 RepID=A0A133VAL9_9EURY|nr:hypothetical protein AKJ48_03870 [candidate division MSBL1 archaeon SCGC-AAA261O19]